MHPLAFVAVASFAWLVIALLIDRLILAPLCLVCANAVTLELTFKIPGVTIPVPPISILILLLLPIVIWTIIALPWRQPALKTAWSSALQRWAQPWFWLLLAIALPVIGHFIYAISSEYLPKAITKVAEAVSLEIKLEVSWPGYKSHAPFALNASLAGFLGLVIGVYFFLRNGLQRVLP